MDLNANVEKKANSPEPSTSNGRTGRGRGGKTKKQCPICAKAFDSTKVEVSNCICVEKIDIFEDIQRIKQFKNQACGKTLV